MPGILLTVVVIAAVLCLLVLFLVWPGQPGSEKIAPFAGRNFAHRGLHSKDCTVPENSLTAFRLAAEAGYGIELIFSFRKTVKWWCSTTTRCHGFAGLRAG